MAKCDYCGKTDGIPFDCPYCGGSFCSDHRLPPSHQCANEEKWRNRKPASRTVSPEHDPATPSASPVDHRESGSSGEKTPRPKYPVGRYGIALILIALVIIAGVVVIAGKISNAGSGTTGGAAVAGCVTIRTVGTTQAAVPALSPSETPHQSGVVVITVPTPAATGTTATVAAATTSPAASNGFRPATGTIVAGKSLSGGIGNMTIDNTGGDADVVSILTYRNSNRTLIAVYIRQGTSTKLRKFADGDYTMYIHSGGNWDPGTRRFTENTDYWKFTDPITFTTTQRRSGSTYTTVYTDWTVRIYPSIAGNAESEPVAKDNFPDL